MLGGDGLEQVNRLGPISEGVYMTSAYFKDIDTPANRQFVEKYRARFPDGAAPNQSAVGTYDALYLLKRVIENVGHRPPGHPGRAGQHRNGERRRSRASPGPSRSTATGTCPTSASSSAWSATARSFR